jgi:hypothetical protein
MGPSSTTSGRAFTVNMCDIAPSKKMFIFFLKIARADNYGKNFGLGGF